MENIGKLELKCAVLKSIQLKSSNSVNYDLKVIKRVRMRNKQTYKQTISLKA
jgi:hypothetical protein